MAERKWYNINMAFYQVSPIGIVGSDFVVLTYSSPLSLHDGHIVEIPVGRRKFVGVVLQKVTKPDFETKEILRLLFDRPLPPALLKLHSWLSEFYTTHPGTVWQTILPAGLAKNRRAINKRTSSPLSDRTNVLFTDDQINAMSQLVKMKSGTAVLRGVTGSGKTEVYKAMAMESATHGKSSIILVPEISLTTQLVDEFRRDFQRVVVTHSTMTEAERMAIWREVLDSIEPTVVIGPRSALFMPVANLGLIVIDECHEPSYKQEKSPRYNALRAASFLAKQTNSRLILGSATPLIADVYAAKRLNRPIIEMKQLAKRDAVRPTTAIIDLTKKGVLAKGSRVFSHKLLTEIEQTLNSNRQVLLFHNRRGTASTTLCEDCGWAAMCSRCYLPLTLHADKFELRCHICNQRDKVPTKCPDCANTSIIHRGIGTKRIEEEIIKLFPTAHVKRFDGDNAKGEAVQDMYASLKNGDIDIIIGTQTIAKGLDLPNLALVGIVQADAGLMLPDFSSNERTFQLVAQACGRVGRRREPSRVIVQTYQPDSPAVQFGTAQDYDAFYNHEITTRKIGHFPPYSHLLKMTCSYKTERGAINAATKMANKIRNTMGPGTTRILGPAPAFYERQRDNWRWQIVVRSSSRAELAKIAATIPTTKWQVEIDPVSLI